MTILRHVIDPPLVDGRVPGGFAHGIGNATYEEDPLHLPGALVMPSRIVAAIDCDGRIPPEGPQ